jgi:hypothetical protein
MRMNCVPVMHMTQTAELPLPERLANCKKGLSNQKLGQLKQGRQVLGADDWVQES